MSDLPRWVIVAVICACILGLIVWARGADHHRGEDVGTHTAPYTSTRIPAG